MQHNDLKDKAAALGLNGESYDDVNDAIKKALKNAKPSAIIMVCGSVFVVGEVNAELFVNSAARSTGLQR